MSVITSKSSTTSCLYLNNNKKFQDTARQEKQTKERLAREKDVLIAEKFQLEQKLEDTRLELELKEEKVNGLNRELEELTFGGNTEEEIAQLKRSKVEFEKRCKEQEEELDEMAGQIQVIILRHHLMTNILMCPF